MVLVSVLADSENPIGADNQQGSQGIIDTDDPSTTKRRTSLLILFDKDGDIV